LIPTSLSTSTTFKKKEFQLKKNVKKINRKSYVFHHSSLFLLFFRYSQPPTNFSKLIFARQNFKTEKKILSQENICGCGHFIIDNLLNVVNKKKYDVMCKIMVATQQQIQISCP